MKDLETDTPDMALTENSQVVATHVLHMLGCIYL